MPVALAGELHFFDPETGERRRMSERRGLALMLAPYLLGLAALVLVPAAITFWLALYEYDLIRSPEWIGLDNFRELVDDEIFRTSLRNSLMFILFAVPLRLLGRARVRAPAPPALPRRRRLPDRPPTCRRSCPTSPTRCSGSGSSTRSTGRSTSLLDAIGVPQGRWLTDPLHAQWAVILMSLFTIGEGFLVALATRQSLPRELYELASLESASPLYVFSRVTLPLMAPTLLLLLFRDTIFSFQANFVPALVIFDGGPPPYATTYLPLFVYQNAFEYLRYGYAAAATLVMFGITAAIVFAQYLVVRRWRHAVRVLGGLRQTTKPSSSSRRTSRGASLGAAEQLAQRPARRAARAARAWPRRAGTRNRKPPAAPARASTARAAGRGARTHLEDVVVREARAARSSSASSSRTRRKSCGREQPLDVRAAG